MTTDNTFSFTPYLSNLSKLYGVYYNFVIIVPMKMNRVKFKCYIILFNHLNYIILYVFFKTKFKHVFVVEREEERGIQRHESSPPLRRNDLGTTRHTTRIHSVYDLLGMYVYVCVCAKTAEQITK